MDGDCKRFYWGMEKHLEEASEILPDSLKDSIVLILFVEMKPYTYRSHRRIFRDITAYLGWENAYRYAKEGFSRRSAYVNVDILYFFIDYLDRVPFDDIYPHLSDMMDDFEQLYRNSRMSKSVSHVMNKLSIEGRDEEGELFDLYELRLYELIGKTEKHEYGCLLYLINDFDPFLSKIDVRRGLPAEALEFIEGIYDEIVDSKKGDKAIRRLKKLLTGSNIDAKKVFGPVRGIELGDSYVNPADCHESSDFMGDTYAEMERSDLISIKIGNVIQCYNRSILFKSLLKSQYVFMNPRMSYLVGARVSDAVELGELPPTDDGETDASIRKLDFLFTQPDERLSVQQRSAKSIAKYTRLYKYPSGQWVNADALKAVTNPRLNRYVMQKVNPGHELSSIIPNGIGAIHGTFDIYTIYPELEGCKAIYQYTRDNRESYTLSEELSDKLNTHWPPEDLNYENFDDFWD